MITLHINGEQRHTLSVSIDELMKELSLPAPLMLVEHNGKALHRSEWVTVTLSEGDRLELMKVAAGG
jgi:thiamine biosynthesis protein ThiS